MFQVGLGQNEGAARLGHLGTVYGEKSVGVYLTWCAEVGAVEHGGPEQGMEVDDVLANKVVYLGAGVWCPKIVKVQIVISIAQVFKTCHVADGGVHPDIKIFACGARNSETKVGRIPRDIPSAQAIVQPLGKLIGYFRLHGVATGPPFEKVCIATQVEEVVVGPTQLRCGAGEDRLRVDQLVGVIGGAAIFAVVAILIWRFTFRAAAHDETIRQEQAFLRVIKLLDFFSKNQPSLLQAIVNQLGVMLIFRRVGGVIVVVSNQKPLRVRHMQLAHVFHQGLRWHTFLLRFNHGRGTVGVVGTHINGLIAAHALEPHPNIGLDLLQHVAQVNGAVSVRQCAGD